MSKKSTVYLLNALWEATKDIQKIDSSMYFLFQLTSTLLAPVEAVNMYLRDKTLAPTYDNILGLEPIALPLDYEHCIIPAVRKLQSHPNLQELLFYIVNNSVALRRLSTTESTTKHSISPSEERHHSVSLLLEVMHFLVTGEYSSLEIDFTAIKKEILKETLHSKLSIHTPAVKSLVINNTNYNNTLHTLHAATRCILLEHNMETTIMEEFEVYFKDYASKTQCSPCEYTAQSQIGEINLEDISGKYPISLDRASDKQNVPYNNSEVDNTPGNINITNFSKIIADNLNNKFQFLIRQVQYQLYHSLCIFITKHLFSRVSHTNTTLQISLGNSKPGHQIFILSSSLVTVDRTCNYTEGDPSSTAISPNLLHYFQTTKQGVLYDLFNCFSYNSRRDVLNTPVLIRQRDLKAIPREVGINPAYFNYGLYIPLHELVNYRNSLPIEFSELLLNHYPQLSKLMHLPPVSPLVLSDLSKGCIVHTFKLLLDMIKTHIGVQQVHLVTASFIHRLKGIFDKYAPNIAYLVDTRHTLGFGSYLVSSKAMALYQHYTLLNHMVQPLSTSIQYGSNKHRERKWEKIKVLRRKLNTLDFGNTDDSVLGIYLQTNRCYPFTASFFEAVTHTVHSILTEGSDTVQPTSGTIAKVQSMGIGYHYLTNREKTDFFSAETLKIHPICADLKDFSNYKASMGHSNTMYGTANIVALCRVISTTIMGIHQHKLMDGWALSLELLTVLFNIRLAEWKSIWICHDIMESICNTSLHVLLFVFSDLSFQSLEFQDGVHHAVHSKIVFSKVETTSKQFTEKYLNLKKNEMGTSPHLQNILGVKVHGLAYLNMENTPTELQKEKLESKHSSIKNIFTLDNLCTFLKRIIELAMDYIIYIDNLEYSPHSFMFHRSVTAAVNFLFVFLVMFKRTSLGSVDLCSNTNYTNAKANDVNNSSLRYCPTECIQSMKKPRKSLSMHSWFNVNIPVITEYPKTLGNPVWYNELNKLTLHIIAYEECCLNINSFNKIQELTNRIARNPQLVLSLNNMKRKYCLNMDTIIDRKNNILKSTIYNNSLYLSLSELIAKLI